MVDLQLKTTAFALVRARSAALTRLAAELPSQRLDHLIHLVGTVDLVTLVLQHLMGGFDQFRVERGLALDDQLAYSHGRVAHQAKGDGALGNFLDLLTGCVFQRWRPPISI